MPQWYDITRKSEYQNLPPEEQSAVKNRFFERFVLPEIDNHPDLKGDEDARKAAYIKFMQSPDDTGQGITTSMLGGAARGFGEIVPGAIQGAGALTGIGPLESAGKSIREGLEYVAPVNPLYQESIPVKGAGVAGQIGSVLATAGVGGAIGKGLAAERIAAGATAAEQALAASQAITRGANTSLYGSAGLQGAASGAQSADQYGLTGANRYGNILAGAGIEMGTEMLPFGLGAETAAAKKLLGAVPRAGRFTGAVATEGAEESIGQIAQNAALQALAPTGTETPGLTEGALEAGAYGALGGGLLGGVNLVTGAYKNPVVKEAAVTAATNLNQAAAEGVPVSATAQALNEIEQEDTRSAFDFEENLRRTQEEGAAADIQAAQMRAQEEYAAAQAAAERQAQFDNLTPNEPLPTTPAGSPILPTGETEVANLESATGANEGLSNLGGGVLGGEQLEADGQAPSQNVVGEAEVIPTVEESSVAENAPRITELARQAAAINSGVEKGADLGFEKADADKQRFEQIKNTPSSQRTDEDIAFANAYSKQQRAKSGMVDATNRQSFFAGNSAPTVGKLKKALDAQMNFRNMSGTVGGWIEALFNEGWRMAVDARGNRQFTNGDKALGTSGLGKVGMNYADHLSSTKTKPITPLAEKPTSIATEGQPMSGDSGSVVRDATNPEQMTPKEWRSNLPEALKESSKEMVDNIHAIEVSQAVAMDRPFSAAAAKAYGIKIPSRYSKVGDLYISPAPTQETPSSPAAKLEKEGVVPGTSAETEDGGRSIPPVETKETSQAETSSGKVEAGYGAKLDSVRKLIRDAGPKSFKAQQQALTSLMSMSESDLKDAFNVLTGDTTKLANRRQLANNILNEILEQAKSEKPSSAEEIFGQSERELEKEQERQEKLTESRRGAYDSIIGTPQGVEMNAVSPADGQESLALVHNSGDVPGVLNAFVGTSKGFLANPENEANYPELWKILKGGRVDEGNFAYGRAFVFTDGIGVNESDRRNAAKLGITPALAAVRRVLIHESLVHRGIYGLPQRLKLQTLQWVKQNASPEQLDDLAKDYPQYENWRNNEMQMLGLCEEFLAKKVEKLTRIPTNGPLARLMDILKDIWRWITGNTSEPTVENLRDVVKLLKAGVEAADARLVNGGKVDIKESRPSYSSPLESQLAQAAERMRAMREKQVPQEVEPSSGGLSEADGFISERMVNGYGSDKAIVLYHGGPKVEQWQKNEERLAQDAFAGFHLTENKEMAKRYAANSTDAKNAVVTPYYARIAKLWDTRWKNGAPPTIESLADWQTFPETKNGQYRLPLFEDNYIEAAKSGYDGVISDTFLGDQTGDYSGAQIVVFDPKSNIFPFNPESSRAAGGTSPQQIRNEIRKAYDRAIIGDGSIQASLQKVFDEAKAQIPTLTERQFGEQVQALYEDGSAFLVPTDRSADMLAAGEKWGVYDVAGLPASYVGIMPVEVRASRVEKDVNTAIHSARGITGKVDKIVNGLPANSYTGKPLQDAMSQSFAPLGSQKFYDETKALIVAAIDDMVKRGIDPGDILATVIQPDFTEEAMKGWNESAKSVAKSIYFNHGLLLAVQKQEQLMNDGDITAANQQQDKIDAWSKFWFNLTNNFGVTGNAIQRAMEDPAYQGLYLLTNFAAQTQKGQREVTDSNVANPNEVAKDINDAGTKSKGEADSDVSDAVTGIQVDDEIAIGEAALTPENKTLWEETKNYLRTLARLTKARLKILAKNIKASNAAESADAEEARYVQMGLAGVDKLIAETQAKINKNFKKILGIPEAGKTRKPRTPKEEAVHPLIARMIARTAAKLNAGTNLDAALADLMPETPSYRDRIVDDVVSGIVGRANRSIKKPKAPGVLADLTKQLKKILSENIKVETKSLPEESLAKKALRAFGYVTSNEQLVHEAWDKAREQVRTSLRDGNLVETNETIEDKLNAILGEIPTQLYSTAQARSVIKDALEGTKFDNTKEILDDVKGAREMALKNINDAVAKDGDVDPARWQRDQSYILNAFDALVADLQKARDAGIAASNKAVRDAVFGADAQKALKIIIRKLTAARPGIDAPLAPALAWKRLFEMTQTDQGQIKGRMFDIVNDEPAFADLDNADKQKLADILEKAWDARRTQILEKEFDRLRIKHRNRITKKAAKVFDKRPAILRKIDSGVFDYDDLAVLVGEEFGIKPLTAAENKRAKEISARLSEEISPHERTKLQNELQEMMVNKNLSLGEMLKAWWISAVLTGPRTAFTIGWSFLSGGYELMGHAATVLLNPKMSMAEKGAAIGDSIKNWWSSIGPELRSAYMYVLTGDKTLQDPAALMQSAFFDNQFRKEMGRFSFSVAEKMIASKNPLIRYAGWFMTYGSRILNALDAFNFNITKAGSAPLVYSMLNNSYQAGSFQTSKLFKEARKKIIANEYGGTEPADTSRLNSWARNAAYQELSKITALAENMNQVARQSNFTLEPTGFGGWLYSGLKFADAFVQKKSEAFVARMKQDLLQNGGTAFDKVMVGVAELIQAGAMQTLPILGLQFAKFALNKLNQTISFIPIAGFLRTKESGVEGQRVHEAMIWRNQAVGTMLFSFVYFTLKAIEDEPDDEKRGWGIEGGWSNLTPQEKRQRDAAGLKEHTIWWRDKNGKRTVANFMNWPISPILAAAGAMSDQIKYSPDQWAQGGVLKRGVTMGWAMGKSVSETSALSQFTELFGSSMASRDPVEAFANKAARVFGGYAGGYIPRIFKDIDRNMQPEIRKYEGWEYLGKELPYYRRYIGKEYLDIFGNVISPSQTPWSREFVHQPDKPEYNMLSRVNSHGVWLSPAVAENRLVGKGSHKREMTDDEANRYVKIVGKGYSDLILKYGERIIAMPKDKAKKFVAEKADDIRDKATKRAIKQPLTSG